jgi:stage V sporulation protein G
MMDDNGLKAIVSVTLDNEIVIHDVRIMSRDNTLYLLYPNNRHKDRQRGMVYPITRNAKEKLERAVLTEYTAAIQRLDKKRN